MLDPEDCEYKDNWNQATFAAFLTYEEEQDFLKDLKDKLNLNLKEFLIWLKKEYKNFNSDNTVTSFTDHLKAKGKDAPLTSH
jgi:hypothetical protein